MSNATVSRLGQVDQAGDALALFYKIFTGEVITAFEQTKLLDAMTRTRVIPHGKSAGFNALYTASTEYHTPGAEILGGQISATEIVVSVDDLLIAPVFIANIDEAMNHYDVRGPYSTEMGRALGLAKDKNIARNLIRAARASALFTGDTGGQSVTDADGRTSATSLAASIWAAKQKMEEADVPVDSLQVRFAVKPAQWYLLGQESTLVLNRDVGGDGSYSQGKFTMIGGVDVVKSNAFPWAVDDSANTDIPSSYRVNMTNTIGVMFVEAAVATVQLLGLSLESEYDVRRQGTLMVGKFAVGHGPLIPKAAVEVKTA